MTDAAAVTRWIDRYVVAWNSNEPSDINALFSADAVYRPAPYQPPWRGRQQIVDEWLQRRDEPGETSFDWELLALAEDLAVVTGVTHYPEQTFSNLWLVRLDSDGRCQEFTEWWMEHPAKGASPTE